MATDSFMAFQLYGGSYLGGESQVDFKNNSEELAAPLKAAGTSIFEVEDYSFEIDQTLNIGSQSSGAGAGKITFQPFSITRAIDKASPVFFQMACSGTAFQTVVLALRKSVGAAGGGADTSGQVFLRFDFKLVAVKSISWSHDTVSPREHISFEYGGLQVRYAQQDPSGKLGPVVAGGWNKIKNIQDVSSSPITQT